MAELDVAVHIASVAAGAIWPQNGSSSSCSLVVGERLMWCQLLERNTYCMAGLVERTWGRMNGVG